jgi:hypothetical protein
MSELADQATDEMADDLLGSAVLAEAVRREASGTLEFEDKEYACTVKLAFEQNGSHGRGEYYCVSASARPAGEYGGQKASRRFNDRGEAEEFFEEQVEKWGLEEEDRGSEEEEKDNVSILGELRKMVSRGSSTDEPTEESASEEGDQEQAEDEEDEPAQEAEA